MLSQINFLQLLPVQQCFLAILSSSNTTDKVFLEPSLDLLILWQSSTSLDSILTKYLWELMSLLIQGESWTLSGMPEITKLCLLLYHSRTPLDNSIRATLFSNCCQSLSLQAERTFYLLHKQNIWHQMQKTWNSSQI